ncbi:Na+/H+ antiporter subunit E [Pseudoroseomonas globiformis]|uniref:Na+/H+ antiporter subunit E n=1 Tax=Teichococcus globiformis TaxID=2307229 RepID=A0ABV7G885_9PROT
MSRLLPHPLLTAALFAMWLLLNQTAAPGPALVGLVLALGGGFVFAVLRTGRPRLIRPVATLRLVQLVFMDILRSNRDVARVILRPRPNRRSGFVHVPLRLRDPRALAILSIILTATPGTAWVEFDTEEGILLLHVLDLTEAEIWVRIIQDRYEQPLLEIFA